MIKTKSTAQKLIDARPTEPLLFHSLNFFISGKMTYKQILNHFKFAQDKINKCIFSLIKNNDVIMTHCHSTNVVKALIFSKKKGKKFEVYATETRPRFQGRITAKELCKAGIKVTMFADDAIDIALEKKQGTKKVDKVFLGADAILDNFVINKTGSGAIAELAYYDKIPVYVLADSWKYYPKKIKIEERNVNEVWNKAPKNILIRNPAFELVEKKYITAIISECGVKKFKDFIKSAKKRK